MDASQPDFIRDVAAEVANLGRETGELSKENRKLQETDDAIIKLLRKKADGIKVTRKEMRDATNAYKEQHALLEKHKKILEQTFNPLKKTTEFVKGAGAAFSGAKSSILAFAGAFGVAGFTLGEVVKSGMDYNRALLSMSQTQTTVGNKTENTAEAMKYVEKNTNLSQLAFAKFTQTMTKGFVGVRPSLMEIAKLSKDMAAQGIISSEDQQEAASSLASVQAQFPDLYERIRKAQSLAAKINTYPNEASAADRQRLKNLNDGIYTTMQLADVSSETKASVVKSTMEMNEYQQRLAGPLKTQAEMEKKFADAKVAMYTAFQPIILKVMETMTSLADIVKDNASFFGKLTIAAVGMKQILPVLGGLFTGLQSATKGASFLRIAALGVRGAFMGNPVGLLITGLIAAGMWATKLWDSAKKEKEEQAKVAKEAQLRADISGDLAKLTGEQLQQYKELTDQEKTESMTLEQTAELHNKSMAAIKKEADEQSNVKLQLDKALTNLKAELDILGKIEGGYQKIVDVAESFGVVNEKALKTMIALSQRGVGIANTAAKTALQTVKESIEKTFQEKIPVGIDMMEPLQQMEELGKILDRNKGKIDSTKEGKQKVKDIEEEINQIAITNGTVEERNKKAAEAKYMTDSAGQRQAENNTKKRQSALETERKNVESQQLGAVQSMRVMQKQADLEYHLKNKTLEAMENQRNTMLGMEGENGKITKEQLAQVEAAESQEDAMKIIDTLGIKSKDNQLYAAAYWGHVVENTQKVQENENKIFDLTKNVREGYLSALTAMNHGAGEFSKIIGTQDMGVTQMMKSVNKFSKGAMDTLGVGGLQSKAKTAAGLGTGKTAEYSAEAGPLILGVSGQEMEARTGRLSQVGKRALANNKGAPIVGSALGLNANTAGALTDVNATTGGVPMAKNWQNIVKGGNLGEKAQTAAGKESVVAANLGLAGTAAAGVGANGPKANPAGWALPSSHGETVGVSSSAGTSGVGGTIFIKFDDGLKGELQDIKGLLMEMQQMNKPIK